MEGMKADKILWPGLALGVSTVLLTDGLKIVWAALPTWAMGMTLAVLLTCKVRPTTVYGRVGGFTILAGNVLLALELLTRNFGERSVPLEFAAFPFEAAVWLSATVMCIVHGVVSREQRLARTSP